MVTKMKTNKSVCVFLAANFGRNPLFMNAAKDLGREIARRNIRLIYGGGRLG